MNEFQGCGLCMHHIYMSDNEYMCSNEYSKGYGMSTTLDDYCDNFTHRFEQSKTLLKSFFFFFFDFETEAS